MLPVLTSCKARQVIGEDMPEHDPQQPLVLPLLQQQLPPP